jgi:dihydrofolate reductase
MGNVLAGMAMSLDGFIEDRNGSVARLYPDFDAMRQTDLLQEEIGRTGAVVMGRRAYDMAQGDFTGYEFQVPIFVLTHQAPETVAKGENDRLRFTFVTDGIEHAIAQARAAAGDKDVAVIGGAQTVQQCLQAGLVDELQIDLVPLLLGGGLRLFEQPGSEPVELERIRVIEYPWFTHLRFRVLR